VNVAILTDELARTEPFMTIAGIPVKVHPDVPNHEMWAIEDHAAIGAPFEPRVVPLTFVVTRHVGENLTLYRNQRFGEGWWLTLIVVSEQTAHALISCAEWWQSRGGDPIWPVPVSRLAARARVGQLEIDHASF
jgi:hypothetical protein